MYRPIRKIVAEREKKLAEGHAEAEGISEKNQVSKASYQSDLGKGRMAVRGRMAQMRDETTKQAQQILEETTAKAKAKSAEMTAQIEQEMEKARQDIRQQAEGVAMKNGAKLTGQEAIS